MSDEIALPPTATPDAPLPAEIDEFLVHLAKERDLSPNTVSAYRRDLREFSTWLASTHGIDGWQWNELGRTDIRGFMAHCTRRGLAKRSVARQLSAVRSFYRWMHRDERVDVNPARAVKSPRLPRMLPAYLDKRQAETLLEHAATRAQSLEFTDVRNLAMLELFYSSGLRLSEMRGVDLVDPAWLKFEQPGGVGFDVSALPGAAASDQLHGRLLEFHIIEY